MHARAFASYAACLVLLAGSARAQDPFPTDDFSALTLNLAPSGGPYLALDGAEITTGRVVPTAIVGFDYGLRPLNVKTGCPENSVIACDIVGTDQRLMSSEVTFHVGGALAIANRFELGFIVPLAIVSGEGLPYVVDGRPVNDIRGGSAGGVGDALVSARVRLYTAPNRRWSAAAMAYGTLPLGQLSAENHYLGDSGPNLGLQVIGEIHLDDIRATVNLGGRYRPAGATLGVDVGTMLTYGVGAAWRPELTMLGAFAEIEGATAFGQNLDQLEGRVGGRFYFWDLALTAGLGAGLIYGPGVPVFRMVLGISWTPTIIGDSDGDTVPDDIDACPTVRDDGDGFADEDGCPESDNDGDAIPDPIDRCRDEAEDLDEHEDDDGCPDPDNDGDGIVDGYDSCPETPEDVDGDRDRDGCPENDRDRDGVDDTLDRCPTEAEDTDGLSDTDGCPETDADGDNIADDQDQCPEDAETRNGNRDRDGCPENAAGVTIEPTQRPEPRARQPITLPDGTTVPRTTPGAPPAP